MANLGVKQMDNHWETVTFRQFLGEHYSRDEVYFYLHYRHLLLQGPSLDRAEQRVSFKTSVSYVQAIKTIEFVFQGFDQETLLFLTKLLDTHQGTSKTAQGKVDLGFLL